jgi:Uma2 family endonuclease
MSTDARTTPATSYSDVPFVQVPKLEAGDRLSREEFERRYEAMPEVKKAELIEGIVYMGSPVSNDHAAPHAEIVGWMITYRAATPGVQVSDNATVRLDWDNEPQPDAFLRILPDHNGQTHNDGRYVGGGPEFIAEIAVSSASYDLHSKKEAYRRNGVQEYVVWRVMDRAIDWFRLDGGEYLPLTPREDGVLASQVFPGLWLDAQALLGGDMQRVLTVVNEGVASAEHAEFVKRLQSKG